MAEPCSEADCPEAAIVSAGERWLCLKHFIAYSYQRLEVISRDIREPAFHENHSETAGRFLEDCMRGSADIACGPAPPANLERAQVIDVLLWASELHGRLRRSPRISVRIPILLRSESLDRPWEEKMETQLLSRHGMQVRCRTEMRNGDALTAMRLDNGRRVDARVAWTNRKTSGELEAGLEFPHDENFWGLDWTERPERRSA